MGDGNCLVRALSPKAILILQVVAIIQKKPVIIYDRNISIINKLVELQGATVNISYMKELRYILWPTVVKSRKNPPKSILSYKECNHMLSLEWKEI